MTQYQIVSRETQYQIPHGNLHPYFCAKSTQSTGTGRTILSTHKHALLDRKLKARMCREEACDAMTPGGTFWTRLAVPLPLDSSTTSSREMQVVLALVSPQFSHRSCDRPDTDKQSPSESSESERCRGKGAIARNQETEP